ncbi:helix-turn-helix transcriptional regulator [Brevibacillus daliensis]|uniref:helix-turn-helix transcriptional regulator n=1 Tax=Brevibacillus daliensis TaxID=2892995 RepID=UPI001E41FC2D|nr:YafY family protein [Brevibacillus daliensis]
MNKTDRMLAIIVEIQRKGSCRAEDLAAAFETSVRTIYRDVQALSEAGVPLIGIPGQGYSLMEGYFLPPVCFKAEEASALLLGATYIQQQFDESYRNHVETASRKLEGILSEEVRGDVDKTRSGIRFILQRASAANEHEEEILGVLRRAVLEQKQVRIHYQKPANKPDKNKETERTVNPYGLVLVRDKWALLAFCHLRGEIRHFRLSRITGLDMTEKKFERPSDFYLETYKPVDDRHTVVRIHLSGKSRNLVKEDDFYYIDSFSEDSTGVLVTLRVRRLEEILSWVLGWGADARVLEPEELKQLVRKEITKMLKHY